MDSSREGAFVVGKAFEATRRKASRHKAQIIHSIAVWKNEVLRMNVLSFCILCDNFIVDQLF
jgi:predicted amidohydrolase YtcJ